MTTDRAAFAPGLSPDLLDRLVGLSAALDSEGHWPAEQWSLLQQSGVLRWVVPREFGGTAVSQAELLAGYVRLASACLTTTFILTQRNGACQRIAGCDNEALRTKWLPVLARGERFVTVGISHLTTSRQYARRPAVEVEPAPGGLRLTGDVPWVTGAPHADAIVTGGALADGSQVLALVDTRAAGVAIDPPARLLALSSSQTSSVRLTGVFVPHDDVLAGPVTNVMKQGTGGGTGSLATSALAVGLAQAACSHLKIEAGRRPELLEILEPLAGECATLEQTLQSAASSAEVGSVAASPEAIRAAANSLVLRATQALLAASKGAGFVAGHFAERAVREAMFFLVWSCPQPVVQTHLRELAGLGTC
ncbi:MAG: acyl-CoA dehydrogenase family protein [Planctomycetaceae bacterium]